MHIKWSSGRDLAVSVLVLLVLILPFMPVPGDHLTRMEVRFNAHGMDGPHGFTAHTQQSVCRVMESALAYEDPDTGDYTRINCDD